MQDFKCSLPQMIRLSIPLALLWHALSIHVDNCIVMKFYAFVLIRFSNGRLDSFVFLLCILISNIGFV